MGDEVSVSALPLVVRLGGSCLSPLLSVLKKGKKTLNFVNKTISQPSKKSTLSQTQGCQLSDRQETSPKLRV